MKALALAVAILLGGCAGWQTKVGDRSGVLSKCMSACAASCMLESAKDLLVCPVPANDRK